MTVELQARIVEIRQRIEIYRKYDDDPDAYYPEEMDALQEVKNHAVEDIEFLLALLDQKPR